VLEASSSSSAYATIFCDQLEGPAKHLAWYIFYVEATRFSDLAGNSANSDIHSGAGGYRVLQYDMHRLRRTATRLRASLPHLEEWYKWY